MGYVWDKITSPVTSDVVHTELADEHHPIEFFWAKTHLDQYAFRMSGEFSATDSEGVPPMSGIHLKIFNDDHETHFDLILESKENADIFLALCNNLMEATRSVSPDDHDTAFRLALNRLERWQDIFKRKRDRKLSEQEQLGLFGELTLLRDVYLKELTAVDAVSSWTGPIPDEQDFGYGSAITELKSVRTTNDHEIQIASLSQLDSSSGILSLVFQSFGIFENAPPAAQSLNQLVTEIEELIGGDISVQADLRQKLTLVGYETDPEYDKRYYVLASRRVFCVEGDFPRIDPGTVSPGVSKARYNILVDACLPFEITEEDALSRILDTNSQSPIESVSIDIETLVQMDESRELEFKSTMSWNLKEQKRDKVLENVIVKTVAAFANSRGGKLLIGVDDDNNVLGLEGDFSVMKTPDTDGFELHLRQILMNKFSTTFAEDVGIEFHDIDNKKICCVTVNPIDEIVPVEVVSKSGSKDKVYYIRPGNQSVKLPVEELISYNRERQKRMS